MLDSMGCVEQVNSVTKEVRYMISQKPFWRSIIRCGIRYRIFNGKDRVRSNVRLWRKGIQFEFKM